jgi:hypothetical protein
MSKPSILSNKNSQISHARAQSINAEQKLQALLIADSFDEFYRPISLELPRVVLTLFFFFICHYINSQPPVANSNIHHSFQTLITETLFFRSRALSLSLSLQFVT